MGSWYSRFSKKLFMALASAGRFQTVCDCNVHPRWRPHEKYMADSIVVHKNPNTSELSLYRAKGNSSNNDFLDISGDVPGESIHWELICTCEDIGFTPTPVPTPKPIITPTPTIKYEIPTPTPTPKFKCDDIENWNPNKVVENNEPHYSFGNLVQYLGKVYQVRDYYGTEKNDIPGISNHWTYLYDCAECICVPGNYTTWVVTDSKNTFDRGQTVEFANNLEFSFNENEFESSDTDQTMTIKLPNSNISGQVTLNKLRIPFSGVNLYVEFNNICYHTLARPLNNNLEFTLEIISFPSICPTPSPDSLYVCGEGFSNVYRTDGKYGSHISVGGLSAELFDVW